MSLFDVIADTADAVTGTSTSSTPAPTTTPTPTTRTPTPTTRTPTPTTRTPTPTTRTPTPTTQTPTPTNAPPAATTETPATTASVTTSTTSTPTATTIVTTAETTATSTSAPASSSSSSSSSSSAPAATVAPASATANANASTTVVIQKDSHSSDSDASSGLTVVESSGGMSAGAVIGIVAGAVFVVLLIAGIAFWIYRRRKQKTTPRSPSFDASYAMAPITLPAAHAIALESLTPPPEITIHNLNNFDQTVNLDSTANLDSTLRLESSTGSIKSIKSGKSSSSLWEDEVITAARIPMEKLVRKELISEGGHGAVYHGLYRGECVAMKVLLPEKRKDMRQINIFLSEIKMMATVEHPRIVRFVGVAWDALTDLCAVSEFMEGGDLFSQLRRFDRVEHRARGFDVDKAKIAAHVAQALTYLHSLEPVVLHRDLKSMNILLNSDGDAKLTDFGVSRKWTVDTMTAGVGTRRWMAPEVMMGKRYDTSADIFSFGVVLSELDSHQPPYASAITAITSESGEKITETALMEMVAMGRIRVDFSENAPSALVSLGHACVNLDPSSRPNAGEVHYQLQQILRTYQQYTL
ncbi:hypothetical protein PRNP1_010387 [Phytophthora ramorum]